MLLNDVSGMPTVPFTLVIEPDVDNQEEIVTVTQVGPGLSLTITRAQDGTTAKQHPNGSVVKHMITARDLQEPQDHMATGLGVHGVTGSVVGTDSVQTLKNKTISLAGGTGNSITNIPQSSVVNLVTNLSEKAPLNNPTFTGTVNAPTVTPNTDNTTKVATTAFVQSVADTKVDEPTTNGLVVRNASGTSVARKLVQGTGIVITNEDGVSGDITIATVNSALQKGSTSVNYSSGTGTATVNTGVTTTASSIIVATAADSQITVGISSVGTNTFTISVQHRGTASGSVLVRWMIL